MLEKTANVINSSDVSGLKTLLKRKGAKKFIHRQLLFRLVVAAFIISAFLAAIVFFLEYKRLGNLVNNRASEVVSNFNKQIQQMGHGIGENHAEIEQGLKMLLIAGKSRPGAGQLVYSGIYDMEGRQIAAEFGTTPANTDTVTELAKTIESQVVVKPTRSQSFNRIKSTPYIHLSFPLYDISGKQSASIEGIFEVSSKASKEVTRRISRSVFGAIGIVLLTTFILYPVISRLIQQLSVLTENLVESNIETLRVIGSAIAKRDSDTDSHNYRVTIYSVSLAERIGLSPRMIQGLIKGAFLHDVGKIGISDRILLKPAKLSEDEYEVMKTHVQHGIDIVKRSGWLQDAVDVVGHHHEKFSGTGYPEGLRGPEIPVNARIFSVADVFDALTSKRPYKKQISLDKSLEILNEGRGTHFDPSHLDSFNVIAQTLYEQFAHCPDEKLIQELESIILKYFSKEYRYDAEGQLS